MNRSGRSVPAARRVIEIEEVLEVRMVWGARAGASSAKIARLTASRLGGRLDDQVAGAEGDEFGHRGEAGEGGVAGGALELAAVDLTVERLGDGGGGGRKGGGVDVVELHLVAGEGEDMGDAGAHLARADNPDGPDVHGGAPFALLAGASTSERRGGPQAEDQKRRPRVRKSVSTPGLSEAVPAFDL
jgi:hypothetical protein